MSYGQNLVHGEGTSSSRVPLSVLQWRHLVQTFLRISFWVSFLWWAPIGFAAMATPRPSQYYFGHTSFCPILIWQQGKHEMIPTGVETRTLHPMLHPKHSYDITTLKNFWENVHLLTNKVATSRHHLLQHESRLEVTITRKNLCKIHTCAYKFDTYTCVCTNSDVLRLCIYIYIHTVCESMNIYYSIWRTYIHRDQFLELMHFHFTIAVLSTIILSESWIDQQTTVPFGGLIFRKCVSWTNIQHSSWVVRLGWGLPVWGKVQQNLAISLNELLWLLNTINIPLRIFM